MTISALYRRHRFPAEIIVHAVWLHARFPLSLRMVEELLLERGIEVDPAPDRWTRSGCHALHGGR